MRKNTIAWASGYSRFFLAVGRVHAFTKDISSLTVLLAVSVMVAWALVEGEAESSWRWFLSHLQTS